MPIRLRHGFFAMVSILSALVPGTACSRIRATIRTDSEAISVGIYRTVDRSLQLPVQALKSMVVRVALVHYVDGLDVPDDVKRRVVERVRSDKFMEWTVPFITFIKEAYSRSLDGKDFDAHARETFASMRAVPGMEHSLFRWPDSVPASGARGQEPAVGKPIAALASGLIRFFDAVFLQTDSPPPTVRRDRSARTIEKAEGVIRKIIEAVAANLPAESELAAMLRRLLADEGLLKSVTISFVDFTRELAYKNHRRFAQRIAREEQLKRWMQEALELDGAESLLRYLHQAVHERRYAVLILVDGLQGHLVESLARGSPDSRFLLEVLREETEPLARPRAGPAVTEPPPQRLNFLKSFASNGWRDAHYLPFLRGLYETSPHGIAIGGISTTPTISVRNIPLALTGSSVTGPRGTGIPNFHFVDRRKDRGYYFYGNEALDLDLLVRETGLRTLFSRLEHFFSFSGGAQYDEDAHFGLESFVNLAVGEKRRDFGEKLLLADLQARSETENRLRALRGRLAEVTGQYAGTSRIRYIARWLQKRRGFQIIEEIASLEDRGMPQLLVYYNPWPDHFAHSKGPFSDELIAPTGELNRLDFWLGEIDRVYRAAGIHDRTLFGMTGDHGLASAKFLVDVDKSLFGSLEESGVKLSVNKLSVNEGEGPRLVNPLAPPSMKGLDAVVSSTAGGNYTFDFFLGQGGSWTAQPLYRDLTALRTIDGKTIDIIEEIRSRLDESLDSLAVRDETCSLSASAIRLVGTRRGKRAEALVVRRGASIFYESEADLLGITGLSPYDPAPTPERLARYGALLEKARAAKKADPSTWCVESEWRELCAFTSRPDAVVQMSHLYDSDLAGTVNLFPKAGFCFNSTVPGRHAGELFHEKDAFVGIWGAPVRRTTRPRTAYIGSVAPTLYEYLSEQSVEPGEDGWGFPAIERLERAAPGK